MTRLDHVPSRPLVRAALGSILLTLATAGCHTCRDVSTSDPVRSTAIIGRRLTLDRPYRVVAVPHLDRLMLLAPDEPPAPNDVPEADLPAGTTLTVLRVERCTYPPGITIDLTVATIDTGPLAGTHLTLNRAGLPRNPPPDTPAPTSRSFPP